MSRMMQNQSLGSCQKVKGECIRTCAQQYDVSKMSNCLQCKNLIDRRCYHPQISFHVCESPPDLSPIPHHNLPYNSEKFLRSKAVSLALQTEGVKAKIIINFQAKKLKRKDLQQLILSTSFKYDPKISNNTFDILFVT